MNRAEFVALALDFRWVAEAVDHQRRAFGCQRLGDREADPRGGSGNQRDFAFENHGISFAAALGARRSPLQLPCTLAHWAVGGEAQMRLGGEPESGNFEDRTGQGSSGFGGLGGGGNALGCLLPLVMS